jgi:hypothetical protein
MLSKRKTYAILLMVTIFGWLTSSCTALSIASSENSHISRKNISHSKKPKIVQLRPADCPWTQTYRIVNAPDKKRYGDKYAKKQNKRMKNGL